MTNVTSITFVTESKHHHCFDKNSSGMWLWTCFSASLPCQCGRVIKFLGKPEIGKPLRFICAALKDSDITDDILASNSSTDHELFITTTSTIVDIIH